MFSEKCVLLLSAAATPAGFVTSDRPACPHNANVPKRCGSTGRRRQKFGAYRTGPRQPGQVQELNALQFGFGLQETESLSEVVHRFIQRRKCSRRRNDDSRIGITDLRMALIRQAGAAVVLVALTLLFQSGGMAVLIYWGRAHFERGMHRLGLLRSAVLLARFTGVIIALHMLQILLWAGFYRWRCFPSWQFAFYFSTGYYSTVGTGDLVLPEIWRNLGAIESITGVLMCGLSASFLFAVVTRLVEREARFSANLARPAGERASTPSHPGASQWSERR